jgi:hypothetical protein
LVILANSTVLVQVVSAQENLNFDENFDGNELDSSNWNIQIATNGNRWCSTTEENHLTNPGQWLDVSSQPCDGVTQAAPYGNISMENGLASFSSEESHSFPYIWAGEPLQSSPFPSSGDFVFEVRIRYDDISTLGDGIILLNRLNSNPTGDNPPIGSTGYSGVWGNEREALFAKLGERNVPITSDPNDFHTYTLEYVNGAYSLYLDGNLVSGPIADDSRPNTIWLGNPVVANWDRDDWSDFTIDYVKVGPSRDSINSGQTDTSSTSPPFFGGP